MADDPKAAAPQPADNNSVTVDGAIDNTAPAAQPSLPHHAPSRKPAQTIENPAITKPKAPAMNDPMGFPEGVSRHAPVDTAVVQPGPSGLEGLKDRVVAAATAPFHPIDSSAAGKEVSREVADEWHKARQDPNFVMGMVGPGEIGPGGEEAEVAAKDAAKKVSDLFAGTKGQSPKAAKKVVEDAGLKYKGELTPGSNVHMFEHPDHPGETASLPGPLTTDAVKTKMDSKLQAFAAAPAPIKFDAVGGKEVRPSPKVAQAADAVTPEIKAEGPEWDRTHSAIVDGKKVGSVGYKLDPDGRAQIYGSQVAPDLRGKGVGQKLYRAAIDDARDAGASRITSDSTNTSPDANRVWEKLREKGLPVENITHPNGKPGYEIDFENPPEPTAFSGEDVVSHIQNTSQSPISRTEAHQRAGLDSGGSYQLRDVPTESLEAADDYDPALAKKYADQKGPLPAIVLDGDGRIRDGNHRVAAATLRGEPTIKAYVPIDSYKAPAPEHVQTLAARGQLPNQKINLGEAYGDTGKYVGGLEDKTSNYHPDLQKLVTQFGTSTDASKVQNGASFLAPDGKFIHLGATTHDAAIDWATGRGVTKEAPDNRVAFLKDTGAVRLRATTGKAGKELAISVPAKGVTPEQVDSIRQAVGQGLGRNGNLTMEVGEPSGKAARKEFASPRDVEPMLKEIGAHPEKESPAAPSAKGGGVAANAGKPVGEVAPNPELQASAQKYAKAQGMEKIDHSPVKVDPARAKEIARIYDEAEHAPNDPKVKAAYDALKSETKDQFHQLRDDLGLKFEPQEDDPYQSAGEMMNDIKQNKRLKVYTGSGPGADHPLSEIDPETGHSYNTLFRWVHDAMGHAAGGHDFSEAGEKSATEAHAQMYSDKARPAMRAETEGQTSWFFHNPEVESGAKKPGDFAEQKATTIPDETLEQKLKRGVSRDTPIKTEIPLSKISVSEKAYTGASRNISRGAGSKTSGPVQLVYNPANGQFLVEDGMHRIVQANRNNDATIQATIHSSPTDTANVAEGDKMNLEPTPWHETVADKAADEEAGGINPRTGKSDSKGIGTEIMPELRQPLDHAPTADDFKKFYEQHQAIFDKHPELRVGWDNNSAVPGGHEINVGAVGKDAARVAKKLDQKSAFDIAKGEVLPTGGSGLRTEFPNYPIEERVKDLTGQPQSDIPGFEHLSKDMYDHLEPDEREYLQGNKTLQRNVMTQYHKIDPSVPETTNAMQAGAALGGWWQRYIDVFHNLGDGGKQVANTIGPSHAEILKQWHAALSGNKSIEDANNLAWHSYADWLDAGKPTDRKSIDDIVRKNGAQPEGSGKKGNAAISDTLNNRGKVVSEGVDTSKLLGLVNSPEMRGERPFTNDVFSEGKRNPLMGLDQRARKIPSMGATVAGKGNLNRLVIDAHIRDFYGHNSSTSAAQYIADSAHLRQAAEKLGLKGGQGQEQLWGTVLGLKTLLKEGLTPADAGGTLDADTINRIGKDYAEVIANDPEITGPGGVLDRLKDKYGIGSGSAGVSTADRQAPSSGASGGQQAGSQAAVDPALLGKTAGRIRSQISDMKIKKPSASKGPSALDLINALSALKKPAN